MGKGDKKTAKGKRVMGSYGNTRKRKSSNTTGTAVVAKAEVAEKPKKAAAPKKEAKPKAETAKKAPAKKAKKEE
jgi:ribosomal small subunit protein bTHX